jgi:voltage-gated potassium channel
MDLKKQILKFAYRLEASQKYKRYKSLAYEILEDQTSIKKRYFDYFMIFLVISTILILILEIKHRLHPIVYTYEALAVVIFVIEWLGRLWVSSDAHLAIITKHERYEHDEIDATAWMLLKPALKEKFRYVISPMSIIDLLAILPSYRPLRVLRFLLLFRLFKVFRYTQNLNFLLRVFSEKRYEFLTLLVIFSFMVFFASTVIYIFEASGANKGIDTFFDAIYWAVITISTVGFGDITPQTDAGRFITMFLIIGGIGIISFMTSIVTTSMTEKLEEVKEQHLLNEVNKLKSFILICGYGKMGKELAKELYRSGEDFVVIDVNPQEVEQAKRERFLALRADASDMDVLKELKCDTKLKYGVALTNSDSLNLSIILSLKALNPNTVIYSRANEKEAKEKLELAGAKEAIFPYQSASIAAMEYLEIPVAHEAIDNILLEREDPIMDEIEITKDTKALNSTIGHIGIKKHSLKVLGVVRSSENSRFYFHPDNSSFVLREHDLLIVIGDREDIMNFKVDIYKG